MEATVYSSFGTASIFFLNVLQVVGWGIQQTFLWVYKSFSDSMFALHSLQNVRLTNSINVMSWYFKLNLLDQRDVCKPWCYTISLECQPQTTYKVFLWWLCSGCDVLCCVGPCCVTTLVEDSNIAPASLAAPSSPLTQPSNSPHPQVITRKNGHILPTGQWYAPSAIINVAKM